MNGQENSIKGIFKLYKANFVKGGELKACVKTAFMGSALGETLNRIRAQFVFESGFCFFIRKKSRSEENEPFKKAPIETFEPDLYKNTGF